LDTNEDESGSDTVTRELEEFRAQIDRILEESPKVENYGGKLPLSPKTPKPQKPQFLQIKLIKFEMNCGIISELKWRLIKGVFSISL